MCGGTYFKTAGLIVGTSEMCGCCQKPAEIRAKPREYECACQAIARCRLRFCLGLLQMSRSWLRKGLRALMTMTHSASMHESLSPIRWRDAHIVFLRSLPACRPTCGLGRRSVQAPEPISKNGSRPTNHDHLLFYQDFRKYTRAVKMEGRTQMIIW